MFASTNYVYASTKHLAKRSMCVETDILVFKDGINSVNIYIKSFFSIYLNISLQYGGETDEKYHNPE